jgi:hypothetical protein
MLAVFGAQASGMASDSVSDGGMLLGCSSSLFQKMDCAHENSVYDWRSREDL